MLPAQQRLGAQHRAAAHVDHRLPVQAQLVQLDRPAQALLQLQVLGRAVAKRLV